MYTYTYKRIRSSMDGWGPFNGNLYQLQDYRQIIDDMARQGWRYAGFIPAVQRGTGHIEEMDLIFEKEV